jgi:hypothetical protein
VLPQPRCSIAKSWAANKTRAERETILMVANATKAHRAVQDSEKQNVMPV